MMPSGTNGATSANSRVVGGIESGGFVVGGGAGAVGSVSSASAPIMAPGGTNPRQELITNMPPGEYFIVAPDDIDVESTRDAETLEQLSRAATRGRLAEGSPRDVKH